MSCSSSFTLYILGNEVVFYPRYFKKESVEFLSDSLSSSYPMFFFKLRYKEFHITPYRVDKKGLFPIYYIRYTDKHTLKNYLIGFQGEDEKDATLYLYKDFEECLDIVFLYSCIFTVIKEWVVDGKREF